MNNEKSPQINDPQSVGLTTPQIFEVATPKTPLHLICGKTLTHAILEYEQYGEMNTDKSNVILILHALTGDAHAAGFDTSAKLRGPKFSFRDGKPGWWDGIIGPGKALDTTKYCVICSNVIGSCYGSTGPASINPETQQPYGLSFPMVTIQDWIECQKRLIDFLGVKQLFLVIGGSLGGQQALEWTLAYPERVQRAAILASAPRLSPMLLGVNTISRYAIFNDPYFNNGNYYSQKKQPQFGIEISRMLGHLTFLSHDSLWNKFGRGRQNQTQTPSYDWKTEFQIESYLQYQATKFFNRFDPNCFLYFTKAMDYYDAAVIWGNGDIEKACQRIKSKVMLLSYHADWLYTPEETHLLAQAMIKAGVDLTYHQDTSTYGHDAFLVELEQLNRYLKAFID